MVTSANSQIITKFFFGCSAHVLDEKSQLHHYHMAMQSKVMELKVNFPIDFHCNVILGSLIPVPYTGHKKPIEFPLYEFQT